MAVSGEPFSPAKFSKLVKALLILRMKGNVIPDAENQYNGVYIKPDLYTMKFSTEIKQVNCLLELILTLFAIVLIVLNQDFFL